MNQNNLHWFMNGININYMEELYKQFLTNPQSIHDTWHVFFTNLNKKIYINKKNIADIMSLKYQQVLEKKVSQAIHTFRSIGHYYAKNNFLCAQNINKNLTLQTFNIDIQDINKKILLYNNMKSIKNIFHTYQQIYCSSIGIEYMHLPSKEQIFLQKKIELSTYNFNNYEKKIFLEELIATETFETFFGKNFPGTKRFSIEGCDVIIPVIKEVVRYISNTTLQKTNTIIIGMAHRGRLNILANIMGKSIQQIINEFNETDINVSIADDVKYHLGYSSVININQKNINLHLVCNPSHLEYINPVVMGITRSYYDYYSKDMILPIMIHGDASIVGQGIVQETLNMSYTNGYNIHGTIHIIINNQIGFTNSDINDLRSSYYCTDIAKIIGCPIFHINADSIEDVIYIIRLAIIYRNSFHKDVFIDLISYRRHGHSEIDDPYMTQPMMYNLIKQHDTVQTIYQQKLLSEKLIDQKFIYKLYDKYNTLLQKKYCLTYTKQIYPQNLNKNNDSKNNHFTKKTLKNLFYTISIIPKYINMHKRVKNIYLDRLLMCEEKKLLDWGAAESLAYATVLAQGFSCRITGEDSIRGTFAHRHAIIYDQNNDNIYIPLQNISTTQGNFYIYNSVLSEAAVLGFEYGYTLQNRNLTIWEAQFGDFANASQVIIDQFIVSGKKKWNYISNLVLLLPHGYEGQGPEHSSARIERYLQLCAENNIQVCVPTTAAQIYHLLCTQIHNNKPLIIFTPKSLLRHELSFSSLSSFVDHHFIKVLLETEIIHNIQRVIFCTGKIYYELLEYRKKNNYMNTALIRIEQLYPLPIEDLKKIIHKYIICVKNFFWCQEEPENQGAWIYIQYYFYKKLHHRINYIGREKSSSTATGYISIHKKQQNKILFTAFNTNTNNLLLKK
ncbi:2-oxoglutarate dehydrogenase E1 component [Enterobacteriaceae endosymbiont of Macroplea mutica]|uniref:2-oxoglutarate dehydrogenase E1 component n=1 Tax=Enterobacteriaceae endosymbiont of Macroplea mutica TaxID=2675791 RepID=UPI001448F88F|nr:2-oxoglutarate dehydrogenase E1 component [Enterobacteriaceae endosymbiont of Macroplea mutica]QJC31231.1 2-oxoglutarate dehydrogenase E1 component [Enterobacteriaceae endosymbiont of Macroplea mutica]